MANLFTVTAPLLLAYPDGSKRAIAGVFPHPDGVLFVDLYWQEEAAPVVHMLAGELRGEGPWKIADTVIRIISCGDTEQSIQWTMWQQYLLGRDADADNVKLANILGLHATRPVTDG